MWASKTMQHYHCKTITPTGNRVSSAMFVHDNGRATFETLVDGPDVAGPVDEWDDGIKFHVSFQEMLEYHMHNVEMLS